MHTVNKAYSVLRQEGFLKLDRRKGAVVSLDVDKYQALEEMKQNLDVVLACGICRNISRQEVHQLVDYIYDAYLNGCTGCEKGSRMIPAESLCEKGGFLCCARNVEFVKQILNIRKL